MSFQDLSDHVFWRDVLLTLAHIVACVGILYTMNVRGNRKEERAFWILGALGAFFRPFTLVEPLLGWLELVGVVMFGVVLWSPFSRGVRRTTQTMSRVQSLKDENCRLRRENMELQRERTIVREFVRGLPLAVATFTPPTDDGNGMDLILCSTHWLDFHGHAGMALEEAEGTSHYTLNPEVSQNEVFRAVHNRVSRTGEPEGDDADLFLQKAVAWRAWGGPGNGVSLAAIRVATTKIPTARPPNEIRAKTAVLETLLARIEAHHG